MKLKIVRDSDQLGYLAAEYFLNLSKQHDSPVVGLATGNTPIPLYKRLVELYRQGDLDMSGFRTVNLDEYLGIEPDHPSSFRSYMKRHLFDHVNLDQAKTHLPDSNPADVLKECADYHRIFERYGYPDLMILGLGLNGHIGFNEPGTSFDSLSHVAALSLKTRMANASAFGGDYNQVPSSAITMGIGEIKKSKQILLLVDGENKASILYKALYEEITTQVPASALQTHPNLVVIADQAAAKLFKSE
jgi:glucosamine-6-phosphate deaminase